MFGQYQTIIVGAGPAGLLAGRYLGNSLILEKKKEIGKPVQCGEAISRRALAFQDIKPSSDWVCCEIHRLARIMPNGKSMGAWHKKPVGYVIDREKFEKYLAGNCQAEIKLNTEVVDLSQKNNLWEVITKNGEVFRAKYVIGADGPFSIVRRKVFPENEQKIDFIPAIEYLVETERDLETSTLQIYLDNEKYPQGYAWIFPKSRNTANIGVGGRGVEKKLFDDFLENTVKREYGKYKLLENKSGVVPIRRTGFIHCKDNLVLIGDAAGSVNALFKGGINQAMICGKIAGQCILQNNLAGHKAKIKRHLSLTRETDKATQIWHSFSNNILNALGEVLEQRGSSYLFTPQGFLRICRSPVLRKNIKNLLKFFRTWRKYRRYLW